MSDREFSAGSVLAAVVWALAFMLMLGGTAVAIFDGGHVQTMTLMAYAIFTSVAGAALTMRQCARQNRQAMMEAVRLMSRPSDDGVSSLSRRR